MLRRRGMNEPNRETMALQDYVDVLRRRRWIILAAVVLVPLLAVGYSLQQTPVYEASAKVLLSQQSVANSLTGINDPNASVQDLIRVQTQADVARAPEIAEGVVAAVDGLESSPDQFLADSSAVVVEDTEILEFTVSNTDPDLAVAGAAEYANQYTKYRQKLDTASPGAARRAVSKRLEELAAAGEDGERSLLLTRKARARAPHSSDASDLQRQGDRDPRRRLTGFPTAGSRRGDGAPARGGPGSRVGLRPRSTRHSRPRSR